MTDYLKFRKMLDSRGLAYDFDVMSEEYKVRIDRHYVVSVPARIARYDVGAATELIRTALELEAMFGS